MDLMNGNHHVSLPHTEPEAYFLFYCNSQFEGIYVILAIPGWLLALLEIITWLVWEYGWAAGVFQAPQVILMCNDGCKWLTWRLFQEDEEN